MKKLFTLMLALALLLSLGLMAGCSGDEPAEKPDESEGPAPAESKAAEEESGEFITDAAERIANGEDVLVCFCSQSLSDDFMLGYDARLKEFLRATDAATIPAPQIPPSPCSSSRWKTAP